VGIQAIRTKHVYETRFHAFTPVLIFSNNSSPGSKDSLGGFALHCRTDRERMMPVKASCLFLYAVLPLQGAWGTTGIWVNNNVTPNSVSAFKYDGTNIVPLGITLTGGSGAPGSTNRAARRIVRRRGLTGGKTHLYATNGGDHTITPMTADSQSCLVEN